MSQYVISIHAPNIKPKDRHPQIFEAFDSLQSGEQMLLTNDHEPRPLYYQFLIEREGTFTWEPLEEGPSIWKIIIGKR